MTDDPRRHWHGNPGNRYEHTNVWVQGGPKGPTARAPWALTPEMIANTRRVRNSPPHTSRLCQTSDPIQSTLILYNTPSIPNQHQYHSNMAPRHDQQSSSTSTSSTGSASNSNSNSNTTKNNAANESPTLPSVKDRRRSSASSGGPLFSTLQTQKRESSDPGMAGRRASWNEQAQKGGVFSRLWEGYTRGK
ncbi:uncharacterized protein N7459_005948 [Penicillium hispanicum]|uniref:uncharacterized protein n=1 Tax=Penicillium hispanicum TaxID=1080232 RepID=UPI00253F6DE5|nr:uncharacterized protein N7459_005948 [Penicillium hispanicum]KAJ5579963.1 hypothetical protein N7459_005948 [Penicillium hispanicum]